MAIFDTVPRYVNVNIKIDFSRSQKEAKFLACAVTAEADFWITGDRDFTEAQTLMDIMIISVSLFKRLVCNVRR